MFLTSLFSAICLSTSPLIANPAFDIIYQYHLETPAGKIAFLEDKLLAYAQKANQLNQEILVLADRIGALSPYREQQQIVTLNNEMEDKMDKLLAMLPALNMALLIEEDMQEIDAILLQTDPLSQEQQERINRIIFLCNALN